MKHTKKILGTMLLTAAAVVATSCVDDSKLLFSVEKPTSIADMEYLNAYDALKTYVNSSANPDFKLGIALAANDYIAGGLVTRLANSNFHDMTAGNAMKYASCVADDGSMNFGTVENSVSYTHLIISSITQYGKDEKSGTENISNSAYRYTYNVSGQFDYQNTFNEDHNVFGMILANAWQTQRSGHYHRTTNANLGFQASYNYQHKYYADFSVAMPYSTTVSYTHLSNMIINRQIINLKRLIDYEMQVR